MISYINYTCAEHFSLTNLYLTKPNEKKTIRTAFFTVRNECMRSKF